MRYCMALKAVEKDGHAMHRMMAIKSGMRNGGEKEAWTMVLRGGVCRTAIQYRQRRLVQYPTTN